MAEETLSELLARWKMMRRVYRRMMGVDYGEDSPQRNQIIATMDNQLGICITELEKVVKDPIRVALAESINNARNRDGQS